MTWSLTQIRRPENRKSSNLRIQLFSPIYRNILHFIDLDSFEARME